ncbi:hypothetical protein, partial [Pseudomonas sp.]|uniref:hypothetical protein n=1 Tax=Pseudomonas sp. TaxID=306 RepID=UPI002631FE82
MRSIIKLHAVFLNHLPLFGSGMLSLLFGSVAVAAEPEITQSVVAVEHVTVSSPKPYAQVKQDLESRLNKLDDHIRALAKAGRADDLRAALAVAAGKDGLVWHYTGTHGDWLIMKGGKVEPVTEYF